jgi:flagellar export protein FliJ
MTSNDPLETALRLRKIAVEDARRGLAHALTAERAAALAVSKASDTIRRETEAAESSNAGDATVEAFAAWLPRGLAEQERVRRVLTQSESVTSQARAALTAARTAEASLESLLESRSTAARRADERASQATLDEFAGGRPRPSHRHRPARRT